jgi:aspartyl-tRNA(Asn)/glutamyl-tRNA(Gln) amidotransferase subunit A
MHYKSAHEISQMIRKGETTSEEVTRCSLDRIEKNDHKLGAFLEVFADEAMENAKEVDRKLKNGEKLPPLAGVPVGVKDNMCLKGHKATCGSKMLENFVSPYDATVVEKLKANGAVIMGKLNMDEFAMGSSNETSAFKKVKNPYDLERVPGGSSGGSAASVAAGEVYCSLGSDTGGSIRQPAAFCGIVGMKPTYGRVSRYGLVAFASSLDQIGPFARDAQDCAMMMNAICGHDSKDSTSASVKDEDFTKGMTGDIKGMKIGVPMNYLGEGIDEGVRKVTLETIEKLKSLGAEIKEISLPLSEYALAVYYILASSEASSNLARFDGVRYTHRAKSFDDVTDLYFQSRSEGFGDEVKRRIMLGTYALSAGYYDAYYKKALRVKTRIIDEYKDTFKQVDMVMTPTAPSTAFKIGEKANDPLSMYLNDIYTVPVNIAGLPGISVPAGLSDKLPVGIQLIGNYFEEGKLLNAAYALEKTQDLGMFRPELG